MGELKMEILEQKVRKKLQQKNNVELIEILQEFFETAPTLFQEMEQALQKFDPQTIESSAIKLRKAAKAIGAPGLTSSCRELEDAARTNDLTLSEKLLREVIHLFDELKSFVDSEIERTG